MSTTASRSSNRAMLSSEQTEPILVKPISRLAIVALFFGLASLLCLISDLLLPVAYLAVVLGFIASLIIIQSKGTLIGGWMSGIGLLLGLACGVSTLMISNARQSALAAHAAEFADHYLQKLAQGQYYEAAELQLPFGQRQLPGLNLNEFYEAFQGRVTEEILHKGPNPKAEAKKRIQDLKENSVVEFLQRKPGAKWKLIKVDSVRVLSYYMQIVSVLVADSEDPSRRVLVNLRRQSIAEDGQQIQDWWIESIATR